MKLADLHLHSTASDGLFPPCEVVRRAFGAELSALALTDHDTFAGLAEAADEARRLRLTFVPGCEISVDERGIDVHLLAYFVDAQHPLLRGQLRNMDASRRERMREMVGRLQGLGIGITESEVWAQAAGSRSVGRLHVARAMLRGGHVASLTEAFRGFIGVGAAAYVPKHTATAPEVLAAVWGSGAVPVLAHPGLYGLEDLEGFFAGWELGGIEAIHPAHTPQVEERLRDWARRRDYVVTGGSDWHGDERPSAYIGCRGIALGDLDALESRRRRPV